MSAGELEERERKLLYAAVARLRARVIAVVGALVGGSGLGVMTLWLVLRGGPNVGLHLGLLRNYFPGYEVTPLGALLGFAYGGLVGGVVGYAVAKLYNRIAGWRESL